MAQTHARWVVKCAFFLLVSLVVGRSLGGEETYISQDFARKVAVLITGESNIKTLYDAYFYMDFAIEVSNNTVIYLINIK